MGEFTRRVQDGAIPGPLRRKFTSTKWKTEFSATTAADEIDRRIFDAALVIHTKLENIRSRLKLSSSPTLSATTKLRAFVAAANHNFLLVRTKARDAIVKAGSKRTQGEDNGFRPEQLFAELKLDLRGGFQWSPDEVIESLVDGIEIPVRIALQQNPSLAGNPYMNQVQWDDIALELNLGIMYRFAEDLWDDCLWNNYMVIDKGPVKVFIPQDIDVKRGFAIGRVRRHSLAMGYSIMATKFLRGMKARDSLPYIHEVRAIEQQGKRQVIKISKHGEQTPVQEQLFVMRGYANDPYYSELLEEHLPQLGGLTLSGILNGWVVISRAALILVESLAQKEILKTNPDSPAHTWLPQYAPVLQVDALVRALHAAAGITPADGKLLVEFFTFRGKTGQEIWASPLVPVGIGTVAPVFAAVVAPNLRRLVDVWMRQVGIDLGKRGPAFEAHVRASVQQSIDVSKVLARNAFGIKDDYTFKPPGGREEQIDLVFVIGSTVFVAEAKCILEPTEAKGLAMHRKTVLGAAEQALRKSKAIEDNREAFVQDVVRFDIDLPKDFKVLPLVVVSTSTHVGVSALGVPVIDIYILEKFLEGELEDVAVTGDDFAIQKTLKSIFYSDLADAQAKAPSYFASPPQVQHLVDGVVKRAVPLHAINEQDWTGIVIALDCVPSKKHGIGDAPD